MNRAVEAGGRGHANAGLVSASFRFSVPRSATPVAVRAVSRLCAESGIRCTPTVLAYGAYQDIASFDVHGPSEMVEGVVGRLAHQLGMAERGHYPV